MRGSILGFRPHGANRVPVGARGQNHRAFPHRQYFVTRYLAALVLLAATGCTSSTQHAPPGLSLISAGATITNSTIGREVSMRVGESLGIYLKPDDILGAWANVSISPGVVKLSDVRGWLRNKGYSATITATHPGHAQLLAQTTGPCTHAPHRACDAASLVAHSVSIVVT
jgi:hypothetical protein